MYSEKSISKFIAIHLQIGSTEWVEQNIMNLASRAVCYLNVDCAVQGPGLFASMTPQLDDIFVDITKKVMGIFYDE